MFYYTAMQQGCRMEYKGTLSVQVMLLVPYQPVMIIKDYHRTKGNCQTFVNDALKAMGVTIPSGGALGERIPIQTLLVH